MNARIGGIGMKTSARAAALATALLFVACGSTVEPPSAPAKAPRSFFGVVLNVAPTHADYDAMGKGKVGTERFQIFWPDIQQDPGACAPIGGICDWTAIDAIVKGAAENHIKLLPYLYGTPQWANNRTGEFHYRYSPLETAAGTDGWKAFVTSVVQRYGPDGQFWVENPDLKPDPIRNWQIWNEENSGNAYKPKPSPPKYAKLLVLSSDTIKALDPTASVVLGGMFGTPGAGGTPSESAWAYIHDLFSIRAARKAADAVALHPYSPTLSGVRYQVAKTRKALQRSHAGDDDLWITELGWGSDKKHVKNDLVKTPKQQKRLLVKAFKYFVSKRKSWNIPGVTWFAWRDPPSDVGQCKFCTSSGLVTKHLRPKPAFRAFTGFTGGQP